ncbi:hypothetical protein BKA70DRAFT_1259351 [Coprinopsis sp. MPI-PUGE-AT-0042]|nr:hypothetical protein BKA70DRAFT_1259351 [Coprinopsis sp. MPI-PUGE-AT-0042]
MYRAPALPPMSQSERFQPERNPQNDNQMDATHHPAPDHPSGTRSSGSHLIPAGNPPRDDRPECLSRRQSIHNGLSKIILAPKDRGSIQNGEVDGEIHRDRDVPTRLEPSPDQAGPRGRGQWSWLKALVQIFRRVLRDRRMRADQEQGRRPFAPPHRRQRTSPPTLVVPPASGASQQPSTSGSGNTPTGSQVPSYLPPPLHIVHQGGSTQVGVEGHINTPSAVFGGLNQAHVNGGTFYAGQTINIYYVNHGSAPT